MRFRSSFPTLFREKEIHIIMLNYSTGLMLILNSFLTFILWIKKIKGIIFNGNIYWEVMKGHYLKMYPEKIPRKKCTFHQTNLFTIVS